MFAIELYALNDPGFMFEFDVLISLNNFYQIK